MRKPRLSKTTMNGSLLLAASVVLTTNAPIATAFSGPAMLRLPSSTAPMFVVARSSSVGIALRSSFDDSSSANDSKAAQEQESTATTTTSTMPNLEGFGVGVKRDVSNRLPEYASDIRDGLNAQSLATILFLFFACLAPAIGFGSVLGAATGGQMGVLEMVASTSLSGVLYAALSAQPVQLIGPQGPVVAYIAALYQLANNILKVPFLPFYAWTGLWSSGFLALFALTSSSNLVQHLTRWTDEIFSVLVSTLFLVQAVTDISSTFTGTAPLTALLTLTCATLTFGTAVVLKQLPTTRYLTANWRKNLGTLQHILMFDKSLALQN